MTFVTMAPHRPAPRFLVIRLTSLGDVLMTFPAVEALRQAHPEAHITFAVDRRFATLPLGCPAVDAVVPIDKRGLKRLDPAAIRSTFRALKTLVLTPFDAVIDFHSYPETGWLSAITRAPRRIARRAKTWGAWYTDFLPTPVNARPLPMQHVELLKFAGLVPDSAPVPPLRLVPDSAAMTEADHWLVSRRLSPQNGPVLAIFPGASRPEKCWPPECFASLIRQILDEKPDAQAVIFSGPKEAEIVAEIERWLQGYWDRLHITPPFLPMAFVAAVRQLSPLAFVSNDTGPMHMAVAAGSPRVVALYREPNVHFQPLPPHIVLTPGAGDTNLHHIAVEAVCQAACTGANVAGSVAIT